MLAYFLYVFYCIISGSSIALSIEETVEAGSKSICAENNPATQVLAVSPQTSKDPQKMLYFITILSLNFNPSTVNHKCRYSNLKF